MRRLVELEQQGNKEAYEECRADLALYEAGLLAEMEKLEAETTF